MIIVLIFVVILAFSYINLRQKSKKIAKRAAAGGIPDQETRREEKELKKKKNISRQKGNLLKRQPQRSLDYCTRESTYSKDQMTDKQQN